MIRQNLEARFLLTEIEKLTVGGLEACIGGRNVNDGGDRCMEGDALDLAPYARGYVAQGCWGVCREIQRCARGSVADAQGDGQEEQQEVMRGWGEAVGKQEATAWVLSCKADARSEEVRIRGRKGEVCALEARGGGAIGWSMIESGRAVDSRMEEKSDGVRASQRGRGMRKCDALMRVHNSRFTSFGGGRRLIA